jgi:hypothetical protein
MNINDYYENVRLEIAKEFGLEAGGFAPAPKSLPIKIAMRINAKYPATWAEGARRPTLNPKAVIIAQRYMSLFVA